MKKFNRDKELNKLYIKKNKNANIKRLSIGVSCFILIIGIIMFTFAKFESKSPEYTLIHGKVADQLKDANIVAVYQGETRVDEIPSKGSGWYFDKAECTNGSASWDVVDWALSISSTLKTKCSIYFKQGTNAVTFINNLNRSANSLVADATSDNNLRYVGSNPNNYVSFNGELWRIIGVMNNVKSGGDQTESLVKIIRAESIGAYTWDTVESSINEGKGINQWGPSVTYEGADLMRELNYDYLGNKKIGTDGYWYSGENNTKNVAIPSKTISSSSQSMIETVLWYLGSPSNNNGSHLVYTDRSLKAAYYYSHERTNLHGKICTSGTACNDNITRTTTWIGKVGLMYPSDYLYATSGGTTTNRSTCLNTIGGSWGSSSVSDCKDNDWLYFSGQMSWTITPCTDTTYAFRVFAIYDSGNVENGRSYYRFAVRPVVFLKSSIAITGGTGTQTNPYTIG